MIISTAPWMNLLRCESMTPERRFEGLGCSQIHLILDSSIWEESLLSLTPVFVRQQLRQIQEMKRIKMVKKYIDSRGRHRVVGALISRLGLNC